MCACLHKCEWEREDVLYYKQITRTEKHTVSLLQKHLKKQMRLVKTSITTCLMINIQCDPQWVRCEIPSHLLSSMTPSHKQPHISSPPDKYLPGRGDRYTGDLSFLQMISIFLQSINQFPFGQGLVT